MKLSMLKKWMKMKKKTVIYIIDMNGKRKLIMLYNELLILLHVDFTALVSKYSLYLTTYA